MSQNTTAQNILKIVKSAIVIQLLAISAYADGTCLLNKSDIADDMKKITEKLDLKYGKNGFQKVAYLPSGETKIYDNQQLKLDRSGKFLNQANAVGVITGSPLNSASESGSAVMISPCHVLISAHSVVSSNARQGKSPVYISVGQNACDSKNEFLHQDLKGAVIAMGDYNDDRAKIDPAKDFAIVRIPVVTDIKPAIISSEYMSPAHSLMIVGFPIEKTYEQKTGFRYPTANFVKMDNVGSDGTFTVSNKANTPGSSGSGVFVLDDNNGQPQLVLGGLQRGLKGWGIQTAAILKRLKGENPEVLKEIARAITTESCN